MSHFQAVPQLFNSEELRSCKITSNHLCTKGYSKMRVCYAVQILSRSVGNLMQTRGGEEMTSSAKIALLFNKWFDLMNTSCSSKKYNPDVQPYYKNDDDSLRRFQWLSEYFIPELKKWKDSTTGTTAEKNRQYLSPQTHKGLLITTTAMLELIPLLLKNSPSGTYVMTKRLNQDPLEAFFGSIRQSGRRNENPDVNQYGQFQNILSMRKEIRSVKGSNVCTNSKINWLTGPVSDEKLPKRKAHKT